MLKGPDYLSPPSKGRNIPKAKPYLLLTHNASSLVPWVLAKVSSHPEIPQETMAILQAKNHLLVSGVRSRKYYQHLGGLYICPPGDYDVWPPLSLAHLTLPLRIYKCEEDQSRKKCLEITDSPLGQNSGTSEWFALCPKQSLLFNAILSYCVLHWLLA